jgi:hypothetical protein
MKRLGLVVASVLISAGTVAAVDAQPVSAATPNFCNGNYLCVNVAAQTNSTLYIHMWSPTYSFTGHFELQTPESTTFNSHPDQKYLGGGSGPTFPVSIVYGYYCATAWARTSSGGYNKLGYLCFVAGS